jgi:hypothetical protein
VCISFTIAQSLYAGAIGWYQHDCYASQYTPCIYIYAPVPDAPSIVLGDRSSGRSCNVAGRGALGAIAAACQPGPVGFEVPPYLSGSKDDGPKSCDPLLDLRPHALSAVPLIGGVSGAAGGFAEVCAESLILGKRPASRALMSQSAKMFFCFGTYTYLSRVASPDGSPPRPFALCWVLGAVAGGFGIGIVTRVEGVRGVALWKAAVPKGAMVIGTVISVHVTSCRRLLDWVGEE